jgi:hypothetical protein
MVKSSQLVAWTENGRVRMLPSLVRQLAQPYIERIEEIESLRPFHFREQPKYLIDLSRAYENLGVYYERVGYFRESFDAYAAAAIEVTNVDDFWWCDCDEGFVLSQPFRGRFFTMYGQCRRLLRKLPALKDTAAYAALMDDYKRVTAVLDIWHQENL